MILKEMRQSFGNLKCNWSGFLTVRRTRLIGFVTRTLAAINGKEERRSAKPLEHSSNRMALTVNGRHVVLSAVDMDTSTATVRYMDTNHYRPVAFGKLKGTNGGLREVAA